MYLKFLQKSERVLSAVCTVERRKLWISNTSTLPKLSKHRVKYFCLGIFAEHFIANFFVAKSARYKEQVQSTQHTVSASIIKRLGWNVRIDVLDL